MEEENRCDSISIKTLTRWKQIKIYMALQKRHLL